MTVDYFAEDFLCNPKGSNRFELIFRNLFNKLGCVCTNFNLCTSRCGQKYKSFDTSVAKGATLLLVMC